MIRQKHKKVEQDCQLLIGRHQFSIHHNTRHASIAIVRVKAVEV